MYLRDILFLPSHVQVPMIWAAALERALISKNMSRKSNSFILSGRGHLFKTTIKLAIFNLVLPRYVFTNRSSSPIYNIKCSKSLKPFFVSLFQLADHHLVRCHSSWPQKEKSWDNLVRLWNTSAGKQVNPPPPRGEGGGYSTDNNALWYPLQKLNL